MFHSLIRRSLLVLALGLALGSSAASASPLNWGSFLTEDDSSISGFFDGVLTKVFGWPRTLKLGCSISSDGQPVCAPKHGCGIDPDGQSKCPPAIAPKHGCTIDPNGSTVCTL